MSTTDPHITDLDREHATRIVSTVGTQDDFSTPESIAETIEDVAAELAHIRPVTSSTLASVHAQEQASELICNRRFVWCRARLLHALAGAAEDGTLDEVLEELLGDDNATLEKILNTLRLTGWLRPGHRLVP